MEGISWFEIAGYAGTIVFLLLSGYFAIKWQQAVGLLRELGEAFTATAKALEPDEDGKVWLTRLEAISLLKEWQDVFAQALLLIGKK